MDLTIRNVRLPARAADIVDIGIQGDKIVEIAAGLSAGDRDLDAGGRLVAPGFVETHIHLDKTCILHKCASKKGDLDEAIREVAAAKKTFDIEGVQKRAEKTLKKALANGTMRMRAHVEVDPGIGMIGYEAVKIAINNYRRVMDIDICVFPQEGLLNNPGTDQLMLQALKDGANCVGAAPYVDTDPHGQIDRVFEMAREFDVDIDMHLDFGADATILDTEYVCRMTNRHKWGGRVAIGHVTKLAALNPEKFARTAAMLADAGVAVTVLPATDLFLMHRDHAHDYNVPRGVVPAHKLLEYGVNCSLSTNNVLNPFTPFGDCSLLRMANLYANIAQIGKQEAMAECLAMISERSARLMNLSDYGLGKGMKADIVILDNINPAMAVAEISQPIYGFKAGRATFTRSLPEFHCLEKP